MTQRRAHQAAEEADQLEAAMEGIARHLAAHMRHDSASYHALGTRVSDLAAAIRAAPAETPREELAELVDRVGEALREHVDHDKGNHGKLLGELDYVRQVQSDLVSRYYALLDEHETDKEERAKTQARAPEGKAP